MKRQKWSLFCITLVLIAGASVGLNWLRDHQRLGEPGIKAKPIAGSVRMELELPGRVLDFTSEESPEPDIVRASLPKDTSFVQRIYGSSDGLKIQANIVLMGMDRSSIHKPEICLPGQGWQIVQRQPVAIPVEGPQPYDLPVMKWVIAASVRNPDGQQQEIRGLYVFWFVAKDEETTSHFQRIWWIARDLVTKRVLQRWAYVAYFTTCAPGQEEAAFERMKRLIAASVPKFQLPPKRMERSLAAG